MRALFLFGTLTAALGAFAEELFVVVYTTDAKVVRYTCANDVQSPYANNSVVMRTDYQQGRVQWHAVGGVPPYKVLRNEIASDGQVTVTVMDAEGNVGTGLGLIGRQVQEVTANCKCWRNGELVTTVYPGAKQNANTSCSTPERGHRAVPSTERGTRTAAQVSDRGTRNPEPASLAITSKPERPAPSSSGRPGTIRTVDR